nr:glycosyltransferase [uncultured Desulfobulbus sp.]
MIRVGFLISFSDRLLGQLNYFRNLLEAIYCLKNRQIEPVIITGNLIDSVLFENFPTTEIIKTKLLNRKSPTWMAHKISKTILPRDLVMEKLLQKHRISVLSHSGSLGKRSQIKTIGWIPDFQHKHLPNLFSETELYLRDRMHQELCENCTRLLVSSYDALKDLCQFHPTCAAQVHVLQFVAGPLHVSNPIPIHQVEEKYNFRKPYFHLPNQFWIHKNHKVVIESLRILKKRGTLPLILATGKTIDHRQPDHFNNLKSMIEKHGLADSFRVLGVIPYNELVALMKNALALINPSLFEGWSSTVEEAKSLGKKIILSDIPIHREQNPSTGIFFVPEDPEGLANILEAIMYNTDPTTDHSMVIDAQNALTARKNSFAQNYQDIVLSLIDDSKRDYR